MIGRIIVIVAVGTFACGFGIFGNGRNPERIDSEGVEIALFNLLFHADEIAAIPVGCGTMIPGMGFFIVCDDTVREYGSAEKAADFYKKVDEEGWTAISMADDWKTIYGDNVKKTELPGTTQTDKVKVAKPKISVKAVDNGIKVTVKKTLNAKEYLIYIKGSKDKKYRLAASVKANEKGKTSYTIEDLEDGYYSVKVRAYNGETKSRYSKVKTALVGT